MKLFKQISFLITAYCLLSFVSCSEKDSDEEKYDPNTNKITGKVEKGPFVSGSTITIQPMNSKLQILGSMFSTTITDNTGSFTFDSKEFQAPYAEMTATGYFFNEVTGDLSNGVLVLRALVDLSDKSSVNVNILTHLKYQRIKKLIQSGKSFKEANAQAQNELLAMFGLQKYASVDASQYSITSGTDESAALIAVSSILLNRRDEAVLTEYLSKLSQEFSENGDFSSTTKAQIKKDKSDLLGFLPDIRENIIGRYTELGMKVQVKNLPEYFDWDDDGTAGNEILKAGESVTLDKTQISVPKEGGTYTISIHSPIPVYTDSLPFKPGESTSIGSLFKSMYEGDNGGKSIIRSIENKVITIKVAKSQSRRTETSAVNLYDYMGKVVATVNLTIEGDQNAKLPLLGTDVKAFFSNIASNLYSAYSNFNTLEQYYYYRELKMLPLPSNNSVLSDTWNSFFRANMNLLYLKNLEAQRLGIYQDYFNVFYAMYHYTMIVGWGDLPYSYGKVFNINSRIPRVDKSKILDDLKIKLVQAIENLEEKKNQPMADANGLFFVSKDVARILLANIYMYEHNWSSARTLLAKVRSNGYYQLDRSSEYEKESNGIIFGLFNDKFVASTSQVKVSACLPIQSVTDVYLLSAECEYHLRNTLEAKSLLTQVASAKGLTVSNDILTGIKEARSKLLLYNTNYFAFLKRNNLAINDCGIQNYQLLFPIPSNEMDVNPIMTQNPGY